jgi:hypothetical protein
LRKKEKWNCEVSDVSSVFMDTKSRRWNAFGNCPTAIQFFLVINCKISGHKGKKCKIILALAQCENVKMSVIKVNYFALLKT